MTPERRVVDPPLIFLDIPLSPCYHGAYNYKLKDVESEEYPAKRVPESWRQR